MRTMRRFIRDHSLSIVALGAFLVIWLAGQAWAGHRTFNEEQRDRVFAWPSAVAVVSGVIP